MKKWTILILTLILALACLPALAEQMTGGWTVTTDSTVTPEAVKALTSATDGLVGCRYDPVALLGTQVVSGTNYAILCRLTMVVPDAAPEYAVVYVYQGLDGTAEILKVEELPLGISSGNGQGTTADSFACTYDANGNCYDLFEITRLLMNEDHQVYGVEGRYARITVDEDGYDCADRLSETVTYPLADGFTATMLDKDLQPIAVTDLYTWYVDTYLDGKAPAEGEELNFWFVTTRIMLNENNEITSMEGVYVPWA